MQTMLAVAVVLVGVLGVLNLVVSFAIIRRLRTAAQTGGFTPDEDAMPQPGTVVAAFSAADVDGTTVDSAYLTSEGQFVGLLRVGCGPCNVFVDRVAARELVLPAKSVLFVAQDVGIPADSYVERLRGFARVVLTTDESPDILAFGPIAAFPTFLRLERGVIATADHRPDQVLATIGVAVGAR